MWRFVLVIVRQPFRLFTGLLFILKPGEEYADIVNFIFEVCGLMVFDEHDLPFGTEMMLFTLPSHIPFPLFIRGSGIFVCIPENAQYIPFKLQIVDVFNDKIPGSMQTSNQDFSS